MQVTDKGADGLKRKFDVVITASSIEEKVNNRLSEVGQQVRLPGFRPGKVPMSLLQKRFGQAVRGEVLERLKRGEITKCPACKVILYMEEELQQQITTTQEKKSKKKVSVDN